MNQTNTRVFIVDDDDSVRSALARLLRASGYQVECFDSPEAFLERADLTSMPACLVLDLQMPGMTGLEVQRKLDQLLPIVFLTGHGDIGSSVDAMKGGAVDFLPKPVRDSLLLAAVDRALARACVESRRRHEREEIEERMRHLTRREREVMELVVTGRLNKQVASDLGAAEKTIKIHRARVMEKMKARSIVDLVHLVRKGGVCTADEE
ncbi:MULTISPECIES: response regulator transcription factor [Paraburkholderia]|uniref:response regulator transcription factor n=1 Tax=Paraburkholderia TaxID=1822464 RepID=UPI00037DACFD|nr:MULTISPECIES: response regulator [Paraburkholderia]MBB5410214.1 FixJ family two-component response regulator [Paraburkholderia sp. HC6.4b]MBB5452423.1 FixJ family two-component response regulator [Paraburkholderia sp. Kb1A]MBB5460479.1 FixJ family two-component response regulator [Paraburkholderia sp. Cpub6]MBB5465209.1 FixJ family two-component response regulator [Paraburkholderia sp. CI2]MBB5500874.1 FixJ family two-component response regulator [Paraburkholderia sp. MM5384-R2]